MKSYKSISAPTSVIASKSNDVERVISSYADIINKEAKEGWELSHITQVQTQIPAGCLWSLLGAKGTFVDHNVLIFSREI